MVNISEGVRERKKRATRLRLYEVSVELFRTHGFDGTTVEAITEAAGTSKGTFFNYFPTKEHVLVAYHDQMTAGILEEVVRFETLGAEEAILGMMEVCAARVERDREMGRAVVTRIFGTPVLLEADLENTRRFLAWITNQLERGVRSGELRPDLDVGLMASMLAGVLSSTLNAWVLDSESSELGRGLQLKTAFLFRSARER